MARAAAFTPQHPAAVLPKNIGRRIGDRDRREGGRRIFYHGKTPTEIGCSPREERQNVFGYRRPRRSEVGVQRAVGGGGALDPWSWSLASTTGPSERAPLPLRRSLPHPLCLHPLRRTTNDVETLRGSSPRLTGTNTGRALLQRRRRHPPLLPSALLPPPPPYRRPRAAAATIVATKTVRRPDVAIE